MVLEFVRMYVFGFCIDNGSLCTMFLLFEQQEHVLWFGHLVRTRDDEELARMSG